MTPSLTIFIDGLPYQQLEKMEFASQFASRAALVPGFGYSVNCQTALFTGKTPDELDYWCEWSFCPDASPLRKFSPIFKLLSIAETSYTSKRIVHRILDKLFAPLCTKNIPLAYLADFAETGHSVFSGQFKHPSLLDRSDLKKFLYRDFVSDENLDRRIYEAAKQYIEATPTPGHVLLTLVRLDHCSHWEGVGTAPYLQMLRENDRYIRELTEAFLRKHADGVVFVVSDHGMANVKRTVAVDLESRFGKASKDRYTYFSEGTIWRVWCKDTNLCTQIDAYMNSLQGVERLSESERKEFGITNPKFGDRIYHTHEGVMFVPSYWGPKPSLAMHGHHPRFAGQQGICLSTRNGDFVGEVHAADFYRVLANTLGDQSLAS